jgi:uncharacterized protein YacL
MFKKCSLKNFNASILGLLLGFFMGWVLSLFVDVFVSFSPFLISSQIVGLAKVVIYLVASFISIKLIIKSSNEFFVSIPFVQLQLQAQRKKEILLDFAVLADGRIVDLASSGLLDNTLVIPRFILDEIMLSVESEDEVTKTKAKRSLEILKKLENIPGLDLTFNETNFEDVQDVYNKTLKLARLMEANVLTADIGRLQVSNVEGVKVINLHMLSNALKPLTQAGELLRVKIQRLGKEPRQGVGYLEDGTMIVINGGGDKVSQTVITRVLSVKHTASGRMIFCNLLEDEENYLNLSLEQEAYLS